MSTDIVMANAEADNSGELLVWPWTAILATATDEDAASTLAFHARQHFAGITTTALQEAAADHHQPQERHFLVLHFGKSWTGLRDAMSLAGRFAGAGRREWQHRGESATGVVYGWTAGEEDLNGDGEVGRFLRVTGAAARSTEDVEKAEASVAAKLGGLAGEYERRAKFLEAKCEEGLRMVLEGEEENSWLHDELKELRNIADNIIPEMNHDVHEENEKLKAALDATRKEIESKMEKIVKLKDGRAKLMCSTVHKGPLEINSMELEDRVRKASDHALMLHENQKKEMEAIYAKLIQLEKQLEQRQALESTIRQLNMKLQAGENLRKEDHQHHYDIMMSLRKNLDQEQERLERQERSCVDLMERERMNTEELQENRQELIKGSENMTISGCTVIGIKRMGELDEKPFHLACKRKHRHDDPEGKAARLVSRWKDELKKPSWHPFTIILVDGEAKEVVDEGDQKLRDLQTEYGDYVCNSVKAALRELNEYNPHERHAVNELWNFREERKATTAEVVKYILEQLKTSS